MEKKKRKTAVDLFFNFISMGITAVCGAAFSFIISIFYNSSVLGRFHIVYAYYIVISQFCVCGIHMAVTRYAAEYHTDKEKVSDLLFESLALAFMNSVIFSAVGCFIVNVLLKRTLGNSLIQSMNTIWISLVLFSMNKVYLSWFNGCSRMKAYAFFQALRNILIVLGLCLAAFYKLPGELLTYSFLVSEAVLFFLEVIYSTWKKILVLKFSYRYMKKLLKFGIRILPSNAVLELNTKIDIICLSFIIQDEGMTGIYSFAAMFGEGFYQIFLVIKKVINPQITLHYISGKLKDYIGHFKKNYKKYIYILGAAILSITLAVFEVILSMMGKTEYKEGLFPLAVLGSCIVLNAKSLIFGDILAQTDHPAEESITNTITAISNFGLNLCLIGIFGITGAAIATGLSYCIYSIIQQYYVYKKLNLLI